jgi:tripartite-type tricarboxylate transporter receptor subunit TctC
MATEAWPARAVTIVVPAAAAGPVDIQARIVAQELTARLQQPFIVLNRPGAAGNVGAASVATAAADGYTLLAGTVGTHAINELLGDPIGFDPAADFDPIGMIGTRPHVLVVGSSVAAASVTELIDLARDNPALPFGSSGLGTPSGLAIELLGGRAGRDWTHVPFVSAGETLAAVTAGVVAAAFIEIDAALPFLRSGQVKALAIGSPQRSPVLPDAPTFAELGDQSFLTSTWTALFAPAGTPVGVLETLNQLSNEIVASSAYTDRYASLGVSAPTMTIAQVEAFLAAERELWTEAVMHSTSPGVAAPIFEFRAGGDDSMSGAAGDDGLWGGAGADRIDGRYGNDALVGGEGADALLGGIGHDFLFGGDFNADGSFMTNTGADTLDGGDGRDGLFGMDSADLLRGGLGNDGVAGGAGNDTLEGNEGADFLFGGDFSVVSGARLPGSGADTLIGGTGDDALYGFDGADLINGEAGNEYVEAG